MMGPAGWRSIHVMAWIWSPEGLLAERRVSAELDAAPVEAGGEPDDARLECYLAWLAQAAATRSAYERWALSGEEPERAFAIYLAELDFEDEAAHAYRESVERVA
jgi:hypothetical protein